MKKFSFEGERGVALIAVVLTVALVLGLFVMTFTNGIIGQVVTANHVIARTSAQCGQEAIAITNQILIKTVTKGILPAVPAGVIINLITDDPDVAAENAGMNNFIEEVRAGNKKLAEDTPIAIPLPAPGNPAPAANKANITVNRPPCTTLVDVDYLFNDKGDGYSQETFDKYTSPTGGTACGEGTFYSITAVTQMVNPAGTPTGVSTTANSIFFKCQSKA